MGVRVAHKITHEVRGWQTRMHAEDWLRKHDNLDDWTITEDKNPAWARLGVPQPGPDGRDRYLGTVYEPGYGPRASTTPPNDSSTYNHRRR